MAKCHLATAIAPGHAIGGLKPIPVNVFVGRAGRGKLFPTAIKDEAHPFGSEKAAQMAGRIMTRHLAFAARHRNEPVAK